MTNADTYRRRAPPVLPLGDVGGAGRHSPMVRTTVVGLVGAQSQRTGRGRTGTERRAWWILAVLLPIRYIILLQK